MRVYPTAMLPWPSIAAEATERCTPGSPPITPSWKSDQPAAPVALRSSNQRTAAWSVPLTSVTNAPTIAWWGPRLR